METPHETWEYGWRALHSFSTIQCPQQDRFVSSEHAEEFKEAILRTIKHWDQNAKIEEEKSGRIVVSLNKDRSVGSLYEEYKSSAEPLFHRGS